MYMCKGLSRVETKFIVLIEGGGERIVFISFRWVDLNLVYDIPDLRDYTYISV